MGVQEPSLYRYLRATRARAPSWVSITRLAVAVAKKDPSLDAATLAEEWFNRLGLHPQPEDVAEEVRRLRAVQNFDPDLWARMELCRHSQGLGKKAVAQFLAKQSGPVIAAFVWRWEGLQTRDRLLRPDTIDFFNEALGKEPRVMDIWACFAASKEESEEAQGTLAQAFQELIRRCSNWSQRDAGVKVFLLECATYSDICDYWFYLGRSEAESDCLGLVVYTHAGLETEAASLPEMEHRTWEYSAQAVLLDGKQTRMARDYFGMRPAGATAKPRWSHDSKLFKWTEVQPGTAEGESQ